MDLVTFLLARIGEDEAVARDSYGVRWNVISGVNASLVLVHPKEIHDDKLRVGHLGHVATVTHPHDLAHIARWDPARVLAECAGKRRMLALLDEYSDVAPHVPRLTIYTRDLIPKILALPYADHPDYRPEWRP